MRYPNVYGIDMPTSTELVAHGRKRMPWMVVMHCLSLTHAPRCRAKCSAGFEASCFDGHYITGDISDETVATMQAERGRANQEDDEDTSRLSLPNAEE